MLVTMKRQVFNSLDHVALGSVCIEPTLQQIRGKSPTVKSQVLAQKLHQQRARIDVGGHRFTVHRQRDSGHGSPPRDFSALDRRTQHEAGTDRFDFEEPE